MAVQTFHLEHLPDHVLVYIELFRNVENATFLREQLLIGNGEFEYAFIDASVIVSTIHVLAAVYRAINDQLQNRLKSRNVHSEIVFSLSPNNNIAESFRRFGITATTTSLLAIKVSTSPTAITRESVQQHLDQSVIGTAVTFSDESLCSITDVERVKKIYKLNTINDTSRKPSNRYRGSKAKHTDATEAPPPEAVNIGGPTDDWKEMEVAILGLMALRGATQ
ncbi:MAG: hypothetical protein M1829_003423 [Trizodia sp. TS-e1964]|nr:MAG: hypothetical protein M1829_003423 [Trizodia sp. TS-e1964]